MLRVNTMIIIIRFKVSSAAVVISALRVNIALVKILFLVQKY